LYDFFLNLTSRINQLKKEKIEKLFSFRGLCVLQEKFDAYFSSFASTILVIEALLANSMPLLNALRD
jgi:hypothetical protein